MEQTTKQKCSSCKTPILNQTGVARFLCPQCGQTPIVRCKHCREIAQKYVCSGCGFEGPN